MPRRPLALLTAAAAVAAAVLGAALPAAASTPPATGTPPACSGGAGLTGLSFDPAQIAPGQTSTATATAVNCTQTTQQGSETWQASWTSAAGTGLPAGCPVLDPLVRQVALAPGAVVLTSTGYLVLPGCTASGLHLTVTLRLTSGQVSVRAADLAILSPAPA
ncbi:hypothetical protein [Actinacidiphila rubida]|uniref:Uncharacterized protein n=1 Tax=Actinacidiphila rubida TaxID=310780 RepID=A0A1H8NQC9_9ACTN|nr:hypothetical protein [Actinacidiphila rubida]SEO31824.1 hypothetical protein SAMN05216267_102329 [Actinacidiphila rubida]